MRRTTASRARFHRPDQALSGLIPSRTETRDRARRSTAGKYDGGRPATVPFARATARRVVRSSPVNPSSWRRSWSLSARTVRCDRSTHSSLWHEWVDLGSCAVRSQLLGSMPSEGSVHVRSTEHARPKRLAHGAHAGHDSTRIIRTSKALPHTPSAGLGRLHLAIRTASPDRLLELRVTPPAQCPRPRLCRATVVLLLGLARPGPSSNS